MSILTDTDLRRIICTQEENLTDERLLIQPFDENCLTPMGYDLRVGCFYKTYVSQPNLVTIKEGEKVVIKPRDTALIGTLEQIKMPNDGSISALILSKVSQVAKGLSQVSTKVDPGWGEGELLIPVQNLSRDSISLNQGETFCTIVFFRNESPSGRKYDPGSGRLKFVKLLAPTNPESIFMEFFLLGVPITIIITIATLGFFTFQNSTGFAASVAVGVAFSQIAQTFINRMSSRR